MIVHHTFLRQHNVFFGSIDSKTGIDAVISRSAYGELAIFGAVPFVHAHYLNWSTREALNGKQPVVGEYDAQKRGEAGFPRTERVPCIPNTRHVILIRLQGLLSHLRYRLHGRLLWLFYW